jgi:hypothetical protein
MTPDEALLVEAARRGLLPPQQAQATQAAPQGNRALQFFNRVSDAAGQGATLGFADEAGAAGAATGAALKSAGKSVLSGEMPSWQGMTDAAGERYQSRLGEIRGDLRQFREESPVASGVAEAVGGLGATAARAASAVPATVRGMAAKGAATGGAFGGTYGAGTAEGGVEERLRGAAEGAAVGGATGGVLGAAGGVLANRAARKAVPSLQDLDDQAKALYTTARNAGLVVKDASFSQFADDLALAAKQAGIDPTIHPKATAAVQRVVQAKGTQPTLDELDLLRRVAGGAGKSIEADERRIATVIIDKVDDYLGGLRPTDVAAGDAKLASDTITQARGLWTRMKRGEAIERLIDRAEISAANFSGSGKENALRAEFRALAKNDRQMRGFSPAERDAIRKVAMGGPVENFLRMVGKFAPTGVVSSALSGGVGYGVGGPVGAVALPAAGFAARSGATALTSRNAQLAAELARAGGAIQPQALPAQQQALIRALSVTGIQQGANDNSVLRQQLAKALGSPQ